MAHTIKLSKAGKQVTVDHSLEHGTRVTIKNDEPWAFIDHVENHSEHLKRHEDEDDESYASLILDSLLGNYDDCYDHIQMLAALAKVQELVIKNLSQLQ
jgi:hypothetical protein